MNPTADAQPPPQLHRPSTSCDRHPLEHYTGFCPSCLCERLAVLDPSSSSTATSSSARKTQATANATATATAALQAVFKPTTSAAPPSVLSRPTSRLPELRRTKSFSVSKNEGFSGVFEPQRKSCDVRVRNTLWNLFSQDVGGNGGESRNLGYNSTGEEEASRRIINEGVRACEGLNLTNVVVDGVEEIVELEEPVSGSVPVQEEEIKTMKDHIDLDSHLKKPIGKDFAGSFWSAASVFSKKWQKWRQKQKVKKGRNSDFPATLPVEKPIGHQFRETQSEVADYGFGRRSCDIDPRFSLDAGRNSFDINPRYSFDEPRASWDGYLIGRTFPRIPTVVSVFEDAPARVSRSDTRILVEDQTVPGGSSQTREYYSDSSSRRRKSLDRSNSIRKTAAAVVAEIDEMKSSVSNAKVTPATADFFRGPKLDDCLESFETSFRDSGSIVGNTERNCPKKHRRWGKGWSIWGLIHRRGGNNNKEALNDRVNKVNGVGRTPSDPKMLRSNSSVSWRSAQMAGVGGSFSGIRKGSLESHGNGNGRKKRDELVLERNRSARYSPNDIDSGLLRFYLTPIRTNWRSASTKNRPAPSPAAAAGGNSHSHSHTHPVASRALRFYR